MGSEEVIPLRSGSTITQIHLFLFFLIPQTLFIAKCIRAMESRVSPPEYPNHQPWTASHLLSSDAAYFELLLYSASNSSTQDEAASIQLLSQLPAV